MFGYVKPLAGELRINQYELYKSAYCGLCRTAGKKVSRFSRFFLSYDFAFMAILILLFSQEKYTLSKKRCTFKPHKKHAEMENNAALEYCSAAFSIFTYYKIADNALDSKGIKKLFYKLCSKLLKRPLCKKPKKAYPELCRCIEQNLFLLWSEEKNPDATVDSCAQYFGFLAQDIISRTAKQEYLTIAKNTGYQLGRFIYIIDAIDDIDKDSKNSSFNPFITSFESTDTAKQYIKQNIDLFMYGLNMCSNSIKEMFSNSNKPVIMLRDICINILSFGCLSSLNKVIVDKENTKISH